MKTIQINDATYNRISSLASFFGVDLEVYVEKILDKVSAEALFALQKTKNFPYIEEKVFLVGVSEDAKMIDIIKSIRNLMATTLKDAKDIFDKANPNNPQFICNYDKGCDAFIRRIELSGGKILIKKT